MPEADPMVAAAVLLLLHVPPLAASVIVIADPEHTLVEAPAGTAGVGLTVTCTDVLQPVGKV
jgi:hypothetical protein